MAHLGHSVRVQPVPIGSDLSSLESLPQSVFTFATVPYNALQPKQLLLASMHSPRVPLVPNKNINIHMRSGHCFG